MKIKKKATATVTTTEAPAKVKGIVINAENFDGGIQYLGDKIPTGSIRKEALGLEIPAKLESGYLLVEGDKPGLAVHPVMHNGDRYKRVTRLGKTVYGSINAINNTCEDRLKASLLTLEQLKARAKKINHAVTAQRRSDDKEFKVLLLAPTTQTCFAGLAFHKGKIVPVNMEDVRPNNDKELQFLNIADIPAKPLLKELAAA